MYSPRMPEFNEAARADERTRAEDTALVERLRAGEEMAFADLITMYHGALLRLARQYVGSSPLADEVAQDTWIALLDSLPRFEGRSSLKTWLFHILMNVARARRRKEARSIPFSAAFPSEDNQPGDNPGFYPGWFPRVGGAWITGPARWDEQPEGVALSSEIHDLIAQAVSDLPPGQREVITLRDIDGFEAEEVCNFLGISDTNQRVLLHRARTKVRKALAPHLADQAGERP